MSSTVYSTLLPISEPSVLAVPMKSHILVTWVQTIKSHCSNKSFDRVERHSKEVPLEWKARSTRALRLGWYERLDEERKGK